MMKESAIEESFREQVKKKNCLCFKFISPGNSGVPDRIVVTPEGKVIFVELKARGGMVGRVQQYQINRLLDRNCDVRILRGMDDVNRFVEEVIT